MARSCGGKAVTRHWARTKEAGTLAGMRFMIWANSVFGRNVFNFFLVFVMTYFFFRRGEARHASMAFLQRVRECYPDALGNAPLLWLSFRQIYNFGQSLLDKFLAWADTPTSIAMEPGEEKMLFDAAKKNRGCLLIGSHFGNLEYARGIAHRHPGLTINVLLHDQHAQNFAAIIAQGDPESRMNLIQVTDVDIELAIKLKQKVERGEWVVIAGDRVPVSDNGRVCNARFFNARASFPVGPYVLASLLQCPVYLLHCFRLRGNYHLVIEFLAERIQTDRQNKQAAYDRYAQHFASSLEKQVAREPLQWFNFFDFWDSQTPAKIHGSQ
jgi:predicted LPLAT superfamily acyltransferase